MDVFSTGYNPSSRGSYNPTAMTSYNSPMGGSTFTPVVYPRVVIRKTPSAPPQPEDFVVTRNYSRNNRSRSPSPRRTVIGFNLSPTPVDKFAHPGLNYSEHFTPSENNATNFLSPGKPPMRHRKSNSTGQLFFDEGDSDYERLVETPTIGHSHSSENLVYHRAFIHADDPHDNAPVKINTDSYQTRRSSDIIRSVQSLGKNPLDDINYYINNGYLLSVNNVNFRHSFEPRYTAHNDVTRVTDFFKSLNFTVNKHSDLTRDEIVTICQSIATNKDISDRYDCFMMLLSSHGNETGILGTDGVYISMNEIIDIFNAEASLIPTTKPKLFFVQACRGSERDAGKVISDLISRGGGGVKEEETKQPRILPTDCNILVAHSTSERRKAHSFVFPPLRRHKNKQIGSWFLSSLIRVFERHMHREDLLSLLTRVNREVTTFGEDERVKQVSSQVSQLTYKIYFKKNIVSNNHNKN